MFDIDIDIDIDGSSYFVNRFGPCVFHIVR